jgi:hypothetical protein
MWEEKKVGVSKPGKNTKTCAFVSSTSSSS